MCSRRLDQVRAQCASYEIADDSIPSTAAPKAQVLVTVMAVMPYSTHVRYGSFAYLAARGCFFRYNLSCAFTFVTCCAACFFSFRTCPSNVHQVSSTALVINPASSRL